ncbi:hypothetical protein G6F58_012933 [Rhizopus delemar]|nr:hypothetical protein G6F31_015022 [Rhizopus arrhizus]KAG1390638.1 hypothetical protein G6F58_012933 [Rhizopus delemar]
MFRFHSLSLAVLVAVAPLSASAAERADLLIRNATVVDVEHANTLPGQSVVIRGEDIVAVGQVPDSGPVGHARALRWRPGADRREQGAAAAVHRARHHHRA